MTACRFTSIDRTTCTFLRGCSSDRQILFAEVTTSPFASVGQGLTSCDDLLRMCHCHCHCHCQLRTWIEECKTWSSCCSRCIQHSWHSRVMKRMTLSPTRGRTRWKQGEVCRNGMIRRQEEENETFCERSSLLDGAFLWTCKRESNDENPTCRGMRKVEVKR